MKHKRHNFLKTTKDLLYKKSGGMCNNPDCYKITTAATNAKDKVINEGIAAHITAAAPGLGAARYDKKLSEAQRKHEDNGLWLCSGCATIIDNDEGFYTVELLNQWKTKAYEKQNAQLGKPRPENESVNILTQALTGLPNKFLPESISNTIKANELIINEKDDICKIKLNYVNNSVNYSVLPVSDEIPVNLSFKLNESEFERIDKTFRTGEVSSFDHPTVKSNSPALEKILGSGEFSKVTFIPCSRQNLSFEIGTYSKNGFKITVPCKAGVGEEKCRVYGQSVDNILSIDLYLSKSSDKLNIEIQKFELNFKLWNDLNLDDLPLFNPLLSLFTDSSESLEFTISVDGQFLANGDINFKGKTPYHHRLKYIELCRNLSQKLNTPIKYNSLKQKESIDYESLQVLSSLLDNGEYRYKMDERASIVLTHKSKDPPSIGVKASFSNDCLESVNIFGQSIDLPKHKRHLKDGIILESKVNSSNPDLLDTTIEFLKGSEVTYTLL